MAQTSSGAGIPLIVGVTGHRDLRPEQGDALAARVREVLEDLRRRCPNTPVVVLSGLAEGADRLVAQIALELGMGLVAVLPMPRSAYEDDFPDAASRADLANLIERSRRCVELPILPDLTADLIQQGGEARARQYEALGAFLAGESHLLLALWDGVKGGPTGGTSRVVEFTLDGVPNRLAPERGLLDEPEAQPVVQVVTARTSSEASPASPSVVWKYPPAWGDPAKGAERFAQQLARLEGFNHDAVTLEGTLTRQRRDSEEDVIPFQVAETLPSEVRRARATFAIADSLAIYYQRRARLVQFLVIGLLYLAGTSLALFHFNPPTFLSFRVELPVGNTVLASLNAVSLALAILCYWVARRGEYFVKYQDYRALAEAMRVTLFWLLAGVPASVAEQYLQKQRSELDWIRDATRAWRLNGTGGDDGPPRTLSERLGFVLHYWVRHQSTYYDEAAAKHDTIRRRQQAALRPLVWAALVLSLVWIGVLIVTSLPQLPDPPWPRRADLGMIALIGGLLSLAAVLLRDLTHTTAIAALVTQYRSMASLHGRARERLTAATAARDQAEACEILSALGRAALLENGDWLLMHRERQLKDPTGR